MTREFKAPQETPETHRWKVFLAGTIDNGDSIDWQADFCHRVVDRNWDIYNPRRKYWNTKWTQSIDNPQFKQQVEWELKHMEKADIIIYNFLPDSKSPITFFELGLYSADPNKDIRVCCPPEFYRYGNIQIYCKHFGIELYNDIYDLIFDIQHIGYEL